MQIDSLLNGNCRDRFIQNVAVWVEQQGSVTSLRPAVTLALLRLEGKICMSLAEPNTVVGVENHSVTHVPVSKLEERIELLQQQLEAAQRLAAIGELTSTTTHEFNNLLMTILNYAKLGLRHKDEPTRDKSLQKILDASTRAAKITSCVLGMAKNRSGDLEPTDLLAVLEDALLLLEREMHRYRIAIEKQFDEVPKAMASGNDIQRVLLNLLTNARQAIGQGGTIRLKLHHDAESQSVVLTVRDNGAGIQPEHLTRIFEPFFSTKTGPDGSGKGGTGLGLSACRDIIERHHGKIRVESSPGKGTAFIIRLPIAAT